MTTDLVSLPMTDETLSAAVVELARRDSDLAGIVERHGRPPLWARPPGFATLTFLILEQQVSLASARAAFERLQSATGTVMPETFLRLDDAELLGIGFSRQKARYVRSLAQALLVGEVDLDALGTLPDEQAGDLLQGLAGIGPWTSDCYLLLALGRPDVWPTTDLALVSSVQRIKRLDRRPRPDALTAMAEPWRPWRSVATRLFWHDYLSRRGRRDAGPDLLAPTPSSLIDARLDS
jgi:DNA-3-methyladenine glycosylase II